jgi:starch synthase
MKIVQAVSEMFPYVKTGGLADAVGALSGSLADAGHEVLVFIPGYRAAMEHPDVADSTRKLVLKIEMGDAYESGEVRVFSPRKNLRVFLVCRPEYFDRRGLYGTGDRDFEDNHDRFIFYTKAVVERRHGVTLAVRTIVTIHNIAFQGVFPMRFFNRTNLPEDLTGIDGVEFYSQMSFLKGGILYADRITTVSPRYAEEIQTPEFGCGLEGVVATRAEDLAGIANGIDTAVWNTATDKILPARYNASNLAGKRTCRIELLRRAASEPGFDGTVFGMVCRFAEQKGIDLLLENRAFFQQGAVRLVVLGSGEKRYEQAIREMAADSGGRVWVSNALDEPMSHLIEAGSDFFLMPSIFEPCGLNQMYSQAYGTVPLVSRVGGLCDTVVDLVDDPANGTGIMFAPTAEGLRSGLERAAALFGDRKQLDSVRVRGMKRDFSWQRVCKLYEQLYRDSL